MKSFEHAEMRVTCRERSALLGTCFHSTSLLVADTNTVLVETARKKCVTGDVLRAKDRFVATLANRLDGAVIVFVGKSLSSTRQTEDSPASHQRRSQPHGTHHVRGINERSALALFVRKSKASAPRF